VILLSNWSGEQPIGEVYRGLEELFGDTRYKKMKVFPSKVGTGEWRWGPETRDRCEDEPPVNRGVYFGRFADPNVLFEWKYGGGRGAIVQYRSTAAKRVAEQLGAQISHFARDDLAGYGLLLAKANNDWRVIAVDMLAPPC
jgi:hypothetical protein